MQKNKLQKNAIALLITVFFIMLITVSLGVGLKSINKGKESITNEHFTLQSSMIVDDVLAILVKSQDLQQINSYVDLAVFLGSSSFMMFESNGVEIKIEVSSARAKINPNTLKSPEPLNAFRNFLTMKMINTEYANILVDAMSGVKEDMSYNTDIFNEKPYLFRDYIASGKHLEELNDSYMKNYHDANLKNLNTDEIFYITKDTNTSVDLNYATPLAWELLISCDEGRAEMLSSNGGMYSTLEDISLNSEEKILLQRFKTSFFEPYLDVKVEIMQKEKIAKIRFEYDIQLKKGSNFVYEI